MASHKDVCVLVYEFSINTVSSFLFQSGASGSGGASSSLNRTQVVIVVVVV